MATKNVKTTGTGGPGRFCHRAEAKEGARVRRRREDKEASGYRDCACRDCFNVAVGVSGAVCSDCEDAQCDVDGECQAPGAYGGEEE